MTTKPVKVKLCPECLLNGPWRYDDEGRCIGKHACAEVQQTPAQRRDEALEAVADARPGAVRAGVKVIADHAARHETFSANSIRGELEAAQVEGAVVGAAFGQAVRDGLIRRDGYVQSTLGNTHGHEIKRWRSRIWKPDNA